MHSSARRRLVVLVRTYLQHTYVAGGLTAKYLFRGFGVFRHLLVSSQQALLPETWQVVWGLDVCVIQVVWDASGLSYHSLGD